MPFIKSKSKFDKSSCSFEKDGMKCAKTWVKDEEYIYDTDNKKAYCCGHEEINSKVTENTGRSGSGFGRGANVPLCRDAVEGLDACQKFYESVSGMVLSTIDKFKDKGISPDKIFEAYLAIYVGKFPSGNTR